MFMELLLDHLGPKAGNRIDVSDADARFLIHSQQAKAVAGDPLAETVGKSVAEAICKITGGLHARLMHLVIGQRMRPCLLSSCPITAQVCPRGV